MSRPNLSKNGAGHPNGNETKESKLFVENENPLVLSKYFTPFELPYNIAKFSPVKWYFWPGLRLDIPFFISVFSLLISIIGFSLLSLRENGVLAFAILQAISAILIFIRINIVWNNNLRTNLCHCYSKSEVAKTLWKPETSYERLLQKDLFHEESGIGYKIRVLRDGTVEMHAGDLTDYGHSSITQASEKIGGMEFPDATNSAEQAV